MKNKFEDIIPADKRSIRNIPLSPKQERELAHTTMDGIHSKNVKSNIKTVKSAKNDEGKLTEPVPERPRTRRSKVETAKVDEAVAMEVMHDSDLTPKEGLKNGWKVWTLLAVCALVGGYFLSLYFTSADVNLSLAKHNTTISSASLPLNKINYTSVAVNISKTDTVEAGGTQKISKSASGTVVIYNAYNSATQILSAGTRLQTTDGHIFKIDSKITVPAMKTVNGKKVPGSVEANAVADQPGSDYNLGLKDLTIPAFKGTDKYTGIYARSKTPFAGGFVGAVPNVSQTDLANTVANLKKAINTESVASITSKIKDSSSQNDDYVYIPGASITDFSSPDIELAKDGKSADVTVTATVTALAVSNSSLAHFLVQADTGTTSTSQFVTGAYNGDYSKLTLTLPSSLNSKSLLALANASSTSVELRADGTASIVSLVDKPAIASAVSHLSGSQAVDVVKGIVDFQSIEVSIKPWWAKTLPDASKIHINITD